MDEPFGALDALTRQTLQDEISRLAKEQRITVVFITHDLEEAIYLGDRVVALAPNPGRVAETIDVGLARPRNQLTTREDSRVPRGRHRLFELLVHERSQFSSEQGAALMRRLLLGAIIPASFLVIWEISSRIGLLTLESLSRPSDIVVAGYAALRDGSLLLATVQTCETALLGLAIAAVIGIAVGTILGLMPTAERVAGPTIEALRPIPAIAFMPLSLMMFGFGVGLEASIVAYACIWPVLIVTIASVRAIEGRLLEVATVLELSLWKRVTKIVLPAAIIERINNVQADECRPAIRSVVAVTVEIVLNPRGLGYHLVLAQQSLQVGLMWAQPVLAVSWVLCSILCSVASAAVRFWSGGRYETASLRSHQSRGVRLCTIANRRVAVAS